MNGPELFRLGRRLMKLGVRALPPSEFRDLPVSVRIVLVVRAADGVLRVV